MYLNVTGLPNKKFYPSVSAVYGNTEVSMVYIGPPMDGWKRFVYFTSIKCNYIMISRCIS